LGEKLPQDFGVTGRCLAVIGAEPLEEQSDGAWFKSRLPLQKSSVKWKVESEKNDALHF